MPTREQVLAALDAHRSDYDAAARALGIWPGQAYLIATGLPADGGDTYPEEELQRPGALTASTQRLVSRCSPPDDPTSHAVVQRWVRARVAADPAMRAAARPGRSKEGDR